MLNDDKVPSQGTGVEFQLAVHLFDDLIDYDDHSRQREIEQQARLNNKMTAEELSRKTDLLVTAGINVGEEAHAKMHAAMADSDIAKEGVVLPKVSMLAKKKVAFEGDDADVSMASQIPRRTSRSQLVPPSGLMLQLNTRAPRQLDGFISKKKSAMISLVTNMKETMDGARMAVANKSASKDCMLEMKILNNRLQALEAVANGSADEFASYVLKLKRHHRMQSRQVSAPLKVDMMCTL